MHFEPPVRDRPARHRDVPLDPTSRRRATIGSLVRAHREGPGLRRSERRSSADSAQVGLRRKRRSPCRPLTPTRKVNASPRSGRIRKRDVARRDERKRARCPAPSRLRTAWLPVRRSSSSNLLSDRRGDRQRLLDRWSRRTRRRAIRPLAAIRSASALRAIRLSTPRVASRACSSACARRTLLASRMPWLAAQTRADADRQQRGGQNQEELAAVGSAAKRRAASLNMDGILSTALAEFPEQVAEIVRHGFAQRIVIDRAQRTADIAGPLLAALLFVGRLFRRRFVSSAAQ